MLFTGQTELSIDEKSRLAIPSKIRSRLNPQTEGEGFYATRGANGAVWLWPQRTFELMAEKVEPTLTPPINVMDFDEMTYPETHYLDIDGAGRVRLPQELLTEAGLGPRVVLAGVRDHLEIWDPKAWESRRQERLVRRSDVVERKRAGDGAQG